MKSDDVWIKDGCWEIIPDAVYFNRKICFHYNGFTIRLFGFSNGNISVQCDNPKDELYDECMFEREGFTNFNTKPNKKINRFSVGLHSCNNKKKLQELIIIIDKYYPLKKIKNEIMTYCGIRKLEQDVASSITLLLEKGDFEKAVEEAIKFQNDDYFECIWEVIEYLTYNNAELLSHALLSVAQNNPHFSEANERLYVLSSENLTNMSSDQKIQRLELLLRHAIHAKNATLIDQSFHSLCGNIGYQQPEITNVKGDIDTLIALAAKIRTLNQSNHLKDEVIATLKNEKTSQGYKPTKF